MSNFSIDIARYREKGSHGKELWLNPAIWAIGCYRLGNWINVRRPFVLIRIPLQIVSLLVNKFCEVFMEMCIDPSAMIGGVFTSPILAEFISIPRLCWERTAILRIALLSGPRRWDVVELLRWETKCTLEPARRWWARSRSGVELRLRRIRW